MRFRQILRLASTQFFTCYTCTMLASVFFIGLSEPGMTELPVIYLWEAALFAFCAELPLIAYYSPKELSDRQWWLRTALHTILLEIMLMVVGGKIGMYEGKDGAILFFIAILVVDLVVRVITYLNYRGMARRINLRLRQRREGREEEDEQYY